MLSKRHNRLSSAHGLYWESTITQIPDHAQVKGSKVTILELRIGAQFLNATLTPEANSTPVDKSFQLRGATMSENTVQ